MRLVIGPIEPLVVSSTAAAGTLVDTSEAASQMSQTPIATDRSCASVKVEAIKAARVRGVHELLYCGAQAGEPRRRVYAALRWSRSLCSSSCNCARISERNRLAVPESTFPAGIAR